MALLRLSIYWKISFESHCQKFNSSKVVVFESECLSLTCWRVTCENDFSKKLLCILALTFTYFCFHLTSYVSRLVLFTVHAGSPGAVSQQYLTDCFYHVAAPLPFGLICFVVLVIWKGVESSWSGPWHLGCTLEVFHMHSYQDQFIQPGWAECVFIFSLGFVFCVFVLL